MNAVCNTNEQQYTNRVGQKGTTRWRRAGAAL